MSENFRQQVLKYINKIPRGRVVSYGQVAASCGHPGAARVVGGILQSLPNDTKIPWWRVINNQGLLSIKGNWVASKELQKLLLEREGVIVSKTFAIDIKKYRYRRI